MKVLILRFSSIGDIVLTTPVVRAVKTQLTDCEVHYATKEAYSTILADNPYIDKVHLLRESLGELIAVLKAEQFDFIIDLHNNLRTRIVKSRLGVKSRSFDKLNWKKWLLVNLKIDRMPNRHIVERYMDAAIPLGVKADTLGLDYFIPEKDEVDMSWLPETHREGYYAVVIGAKFATKQLPEKRLIELCDRINKPIVLLGGKEDQDLGERIVRFFEQTSNSSPYEEQLREGLNKRAILFNACGKFNLNQSASLIKQSGAVFSHDTGLMHIAAALKKQIFSIWGNTVPEFGMYPYKTQFSIFENKKLGCRPCSKIGHDKCPLGHFKCMNDVVFDFWLP
ncbi:MAG: glycosyltransferase family 9 protein [Cyclobacteriaceae bacterium]